MGFPRFLVAFQTFLRLFLYISHRCFYKNLLEVLRLPLFVLASDLHAHAQAALGALLAREALEEAVLPPVGVCHGLAERCAPAAQQLRGGQEVAPGGAPLAAQERQGHGGLADTQQRHEQGQSCKGLLAGHEEATEHEVQQEAQHEAAAAQ